MRIHALGLLACCAALPAATPAGGAAFPGLNGEIAYATGDGLLHLVTPAGVEVEPLAVGEGRVDQPAWSPDGERIAFVRRLPAPTPGCDRASVEVADVRTGAVTRLTSPTGHALSPAWSPDGSRIAFVRSCTAWSDGLWVMRGDGSRAHRLSLFFEGSTPDWSPDGRFLAFEDGGAIKVVAATGGKPRTIVTSMSQGPYSTSATQPSWSPDGRWIGFLALSSTSHSISGTDAKRVRPDRSAASTLPAPPDPAYGWCCGPDKPPSTRVSFTWAPDGTALAYGGAHVHTVDMGTGAVLDLTPGLDEVTSRPSWRPRCTHAGSAGRDRLEGTSRADLVCGLAGADRIRGGGGRDRLFGEEGDDTLLAQDGAFDVIGCGRGHDRVVADRGDLVGTDCERVGRPRARARR